MPVWWVPSCSLVPPRTTSGITEERISRDQGMTSYRCQVLSFEDKMRSWQPGRELRLKSFCVSGVKLRLAVYPNGKLNAHRNFTSIFLQNDSDEDVKVDFDVSMGQTKLSLSAKRIEANRGLGWNRFFNHGRHKFARNDSEPENHDEDLVIVCNIKRIWVNSDNFNIQTKVDKLINNVQKNHTELENKINDQNKIISSQNKMIKNLGEQVKQLLEVKNNNAPKVVPKPECPVCMEEMEPRKKIIQCGAGHLLCWGCSRKRDMGNKCPTCREPFTGRAHGMEAYLKTVFG